MLTLVLYSLTFLHVVNRIVSIFCCRGQAPQPESEDQKGKVPPPPPGSHDAQESVGGTGGGKRSGQAALLMQHDQTLHTGDRLEIQVKAVHGSVVKG